MQSKRLGIDKNEFIKLIINDWWISGHSSKELNVADDIILSKCHEDIITKHETIQIDTIRGPISMIYSKCPLIRDPIKIIWRNNTGLNSNIVELVKPYIPSIFFENKLVISNI